jgi:hypothetical protein
MRLAFARFSTFSLFALALTVTPATAAVRDYAYLSPLPGSSMISPGNNVRSARSGDRAGSVSAALVTVSGSARVCAGRLRLASDGRTLVFRPDQRSRPETVRVRLGAGLRASSGSALSGLDYTFRSRGCTGRAAALSSRAARARSAAAGTPPNAWWNAPEPTRPREPVRHAAADIPLVHAHQHQ